MGLPAPLRSPLTSAWIRFLPVDPYPLDCSPRRQLAPILHGRKKHKEMLVLRRKVGESIVVNGTITVTILRVEGERVKLGFTAPADVAIAREELLHQSSPENTQEHLNQASPAGTGRPLP